MKILSKATTFLFFAVFAVNAQDYQEPMISEEPLVFQDFKHPNTRISVYLHPVALLGGLDRGSPMIYSTVEMPFSLYNALIVKPSFGINNSFLGKTKFYRVGSDLGWRHYPGGRGDGLYLQPQLGAFYISVKDWDWDFDWEQGDDMPREKGKSLWYDFMGYFGFAYKFEYISIYSDTGIGYACVGGNCSLIYDANLGIGLAF